MHARDQGVGVIVTHAGIRGSVCFASTSLSENSTNRVNLARFITIILNKLKNS